MKISDRTFAITTLVFVAMMMIGCDDERTPTSTVNPRLFYHGIVFVTPDGTGDGTRDQPFGSVQAALNLCAADSSSGPIYVASGEYFESLRIQNGVSIVGSLDPAHNWEPDNKSSTLLQGQMLDPLAIGILIQDVSERVTINGLHVNAADASTPGSSSYALYCIRSDDVIITNCVLTAGRGMAGQNGSAGVVGTASPVAQGGEGGRGAYEEGGYMDPDWPYWNHGYLVEPTPGQSGYCADSSPTGGVGGEAGGGDGQDGRSGLAGSSGLNGTREIKFHSEGSLILLANDGLAGSDGTPGCGGGGGGGGDIGPWGHAGESYIKTPTSHWPAMSSFHWETPDRADSAAPRGRLRDTGPPCTKSPIRPLRCKQAAVRQAEPSCDLT